MILIIFIAMAVSSTVGFAFGVVMTNNSIESRKEEEREDDK